MKQYKNLDKILQTNDTITAQRINLADESLINFENREVQFNTVTDFIECHVYDTSGFYLKTQYEVKDVNQQNYKLQEIQDVKTVSLDTRQHLEDLDLIQGTFKVCYNFFRPVVGDYRHPAFYIEDISPSRREIRILPINDNEAFKTEYNALINDFKRDSQFKLFYIINFGNNLIFPVVNFESDIYYSKQPALIVKLYEPLPIEYNIKQKLWINLEILSPLIETVEMLPEIAEKELNYIKGPNFDIDIDFILDSETNFKSWNNILTENVQTSQQIIDHFLSGSLERVKLNIDFCEFKNFIHFSSATERVKNFKYKLELVEDYDARMKELNRVTGSQASTSVLNLIKSRNALVGGFDDFEKYLFFQSGSLKFTNASCSIEPWPKRTTQLTGGLTWLEVATQWAQTSFAFSDGVTVLNQSFPYTLYSVSSSVAQNYFNDLLIKAENYDRENPHALVNTIPFHIISNPSNDQYITFIHMIGHHFDIPWLYVNHITKILSREEHPSEGMSGDLLYYIAQSMGWKLTHGYQQEDLWSYALGTNENLLWNQTGSLQSKSRKDIVQETWRRIVNNLPYILKSKGTERSVKSLLSCYGIPSTFLNIREYGGVKTDKEAPCYIKDVFSYAAHFSGSSYLTTQWKNNFRSVQIGDFVTPNIIQFRAKPADYSKYYYPSNPRHILLTKYDNVSGLQDFYVEIEHTGSKDKGNLHFYLSGSFGYATASINNKTIFDGNFFTVALQRLNPTSSLTVDNQYNLFYYKAKYGKIVESGSAVIITTTNSFASSSYDNAWVRTGSLYFAGKFGTTPTNKMYTGSLQEIRLWYGPETNVPRQDNFTQSLINHTLNPFAYNGYTVSSSFDELVARFPLRDKMNLQATSSVSSSHPNRNEIHWYSGTKTAPLKSDLITASFVGFIPETGYEAVEEQYFIDGPSLGGSNIYSDKIRIEDNTLVRNLSLTNRAEKSAYDLHPVDSNRLGIYFSPQNIINEDISNQIGNIELDDYIGDPNNMFNNSYPELKRVSREYWKKYTDKNNFTDYFQAISNFDLSIFKQLKQLIPARANVILGLVVEPNILERSKFSLKPLRVQSLTYTDSIEEPAPVLKGFYPNYTGSINKKIVSTSAEYNNVGGNISLQVIIPSGSYDNNVSGAIYLNMSTDPTKYNNPTWVKTGSSISTYGYFDTPYWEKSPTGSINLIQRPSPYAQYKTLTNVTKSVINHVTYPRVRYTETNSPGTHQLSGSTAGAVFYFPGISVDFIRVSASSSGTRQTNWLIYSTWSFSVPSDYTVDGIHLSFYRSSSVNVINKYIHDHRIMISPNDKFPSGSNYANPDAWLTSSYTASYGGSTDLWGQSWTPSQINSANFSVGIKIETISTAITPFPSGSLDTFRLVVYASSGSQNFTESKTINWYSSSFKTANIWDDHPQGILNHRYYGSRVSSTAINVNSIDTPDGSPVVEVIKSNPNRLISVQGNASGSLTIE